MFESSGHQGYIEAVRANMTAAGDNASRVIFVGALLAAAVSASLRRKCVNPRFQ